MEFVKGAWDTNKIYELMRKLMCWFAPNFGPIDLTMKKKWVMLEIQIFLQKNLQVANVVSGYW